jgi:hypothetical protein
VAGAVDDEPGSGDQDEQDRADPDLDAEARSNQDLDLHASRLNVLRTIALLGGP